MPSPLESVLRLDPIFKMMGPKDSKAALFKSNIMEHLFQKSSPTSKKEYLLEVTILILGFQILMTAFRSSKESKLYLSLLWTLIVISITWLIYKEDLLSSLLQNSTSKKKNKRKPRKSRKKEASLIDNLKLRLGIIILTQELLLGSQGAEITAWISHFLISAILHVSLTETLQSDKFWCRLRLAVSIFSSLLLLGISSSPQYCFFLSLLNGFLTYLVLLNLQALANKFFRTLFIESESLRRWGNQLLNILDSMPYPVLLIDKQEIMNAVGGNKPFVKICYFNFYADFLVTPCLAEEASEQSDEEEPLVNFLDLLQPEDTGVLIEAINELQEGHSKRVFTTTLPDSINNRPGVHLRGKKFDVSLWSCEWKGSEMVAVLFNNDAYVETKANKSEPIYLKTLNHMLDTQEELLSNVSVSVAKFNSNAIELPKFVDTVKNCALELWGNKLICENFVLLDKEDSSYDSRPFRIKNLLINIFDWSAKELNKKGIEVGLEFSNAFPGYISSQFRVFRAFFFNLLKYVEMNMNKGSLIVHCEKETLPEQPEEKTSLIDLKFNFTLSSPVDSAFPSEDFLETDSDPLAQDFSITNDLFALLPKWLEEMKENLQASIKVDYVKDLLASPAKPENNMVFSVVFSVTEVGNPVKPLPTKHMPLKQNIKEEDTQNNSVFSWKPKSNLEAFHELSEKRKNQNLVQNFSNPKRFAPNSIRGIILPQIPRKNSFNTNINENAGKSEHDIKTKTKLPDLPTKSPISNSRSLRTPSHKIASLLATPKSTKTTRLRKPSEELRDVKVKKIMSNQMNTSDLLLSPSMKDILQLLVSGELIDTQNSSKALPTLGLMSGYFERLIRELFLDHKSKFINSEYIKELLKEEIESYKKQFHMKAGAGALEIIEPVPDKSVGSTTPLVTNKKQGSEGGFKLAHSKTTGAYSFRHLASEEVTKPLKEQELPSMSSGEKMKSLKINSHNISRALMEKRSKAFSDCILTRQKVEWKENTLDLKFYEKFTVLVVDDHKDQAADVCSLLTEFEGVETDECYDGIEAVHKVKQQMDKGYTYHLILTDLLMPHDGFETTKDIRKEEKLRKSRPRQCVVGITADISSSRLELKASQVQIDKIMQKPFDLNKVKEVLQFRAQELELDFQFEMK